MRGGWGLAKGDAAGQVGWRTGRARGSRSGFKAADAGGWIGHLELFLAAFVGSSSAIGPRPSHDPGQSSSRPRANRGGSLAWSAEHGCWPRAAGLKGHAVVVSIVGVGAPLLPRLMRDHVGMSVGIPLSRAAGRRLKRG